MTGLVMLLFSNKSIAHPHSFIALQTEVIAENGQFFGLKMRWAMDEMTSADLLYDAGNASADSVVWKTLADEVMENVRLQNYFTEVWHNGKKVLLLEAPDGWKLERENHRAIFSFMLQLAVPQPLTGQRYTFFTFDPSYYVDMYYEEEHDVALPGALSAFCQLNVVTPAPSEEKRSFALSLDKTDAPPEDMDLGKHFAQQVTLQCQ